MSELKETKKMKVVQLHKYFKTVVEPYSDPKPTHQGQNNPKIKSKSNVRIEGNKKMKIIALYEQTQKQFEPEPNPQNSLLFGPKR